MKTSQSVLKRGLHSFFFNIIRSYSGQHTSGNIYNNNTNICRFLEYSSFLFHFSFFFLHLLLLRSIVPSPFSNASLFIRPVSVFFILLLHPFPRSPPHFFSFVPSPLSHLLFFLCRLHSLVLVRLRQSRIRFSRGLFLHNATAYD